MNTIFRIFIAVLFVAMPFSSDADTTEKQGDYYYLGTANVDLDRKNYGHYFDSVELDVVRNKVVLVDALLPLKTCSPDSGWVCVIGGGVNFAISRTKKSDAWTYDGYDFLKIGTENVELFGTSHRVDLIASKLSSEPSPSFVCITYYSEKEGVLGFTLTWASPKITRTYFLTGTKGYGALQ